VYAFIVNLFPTQHWSGTLSLRAKRLLQTFFSLQSVSSISMAVPTDDALAGGSSLFMNT